MCDPVSRLTVGEAWTYDAPISREAVRTGSAVHAGWLHDCYRELLVRRPDAHGRLLVRFVIQPNGATTPPEVVERELVDPTLRACVKRAFTGIFYRAPGASQEVLVPLDLLPAPSDHSQQVQVTLPSTTR